MSYRLITKANFVVTSATGVKSERVVEMRAYPAPKRDAAGLITIDGAEGQYRRTGGKGRGSVSNSYAYATVKGESAFWLITDAEAAALVGGKAEVTTLAAEPAKAPEAKAEPVKEEPVSEPVAAAPKANRKARREAAKQA